MEWWQADLEWTEPTYIWLYWIQEPHAWVLRAYLCHSHRKVWRRSGSFFVLAGFGLWSCELRRAPVFMFIPQNISIDVSPLAEISETDTLENLPTTGAVITIALLAELHHSRLIAIVSPKRLYATQAGLLLTAQHTSSSVKLLSTLHLPTSMHRSCLSLAPVRLLPNCLSAKPPWLKGRTSHSVWCFSRWAGKHWKFLSGTNLFKIYATCSHSFFIGSRILRSSLS